MNKVYEELTCIIKKKDVNLLKGFASLKKTIAVPELIKLYPELAVLNEIEVVYINKGGNKIPRMFPVCMLDQTNSWSKININDLTAGLRGQCKKLCGKKITLKEK